MEKERGRLENGKTGRKIHKMGLGVDSKTPGYMVREEMQREKVRVRTGKRAWSGKKGWKKEKEVKLQEVAGGR